MEKFQGLGRGLSSLIPPKINKDIFSKDSEVLATDQMIIKVATDKIEANPLQPRGSFDHDSLEELTNSIKEHGIIQPLILSSTDRGYQLIAGERRLRAAEILDLKTVPAIIRDVKEQQKLELALVENVQRTDLNPIEQAVAFQRLIDEFNLTQEEVAKKVGKSRSVVANTIRLLILPSEIQKALINNKINYSTARLIVGLPPAERIKFFKKVLAQDLTVRAAEGVAQKVAVKRHFRTSSKDPNLTALEERLQAALGTKVTVKKSGQTGQIIIEFYSDEELDEIIRKIGPSTSEV